MTSPAQDPLLGRLLDGRYQLESVVAHGGMATVYLALDMRLERRVAVKVMRPELAADAGFVARFAAEARAAARLTHPDVVTVQDQGRDGSIVFLVMEHVEGRTLRDVLASRGRLAPAEAAQVMEHVLSALGAAHRAGIIHRDVKPENVLMADDGRVKVADFGLARAIGQATSTKTMGAMIGTVSYLSPEQVETGKGDARSDVYAAGIMLYELLTGEKPYVGDSAMSVVYQHVHSTVPAPSERVPGLPEAVDRLVSVATNRDPAQRPADATAFLALLHRSGLIDVGGPSSGVPEPTLVVPREALAGPGGTASLPRQPRRPAATSAPVTAARRRRRGVPWLVAAVLVVVAAVLGGWAWYAGVGPGSVTTVPSLLTLTQAQAQTKAERAGLKLTFSARQFSETAPAGLVLATTPAPGRRVDKQSTVRAVLSKGKERLTVPSLAGTDASGASAALLRAGLTPGPTTQVYDEKVTAGTVVSTDPEAGEALKRDSVVSVVVSKGPAPVPVPELVGHSAAEAAAALDAASLVGRPSEAFSDTVGKDTVISQEPAKGTSVRKSATVAYVVSKGPELINVPSVFGKSEAAARQILTAAGFQVRVIKPFGSERFGVRVQLPTGLQRRGTTITLTIV